MKEKIQTKHETEILEFLQQRLYDQYYQDRGIAQTDKYCNQAADSLLLYALFAREPVLADFPLNRHEFSYCKHLMEKVPQCLAQAMQPMYELFREHVAEIEETRMRNCFRARSAAAVTEVDVGYSGYL